MMQWHVRAELSADGDLKFDGAMLEGTPVDLLVAAVAGCFTKSCQVVQEARGEPKTKVVAEVTGTKGQGLPNRVGHIRIAWSLPDLDFDTAARIAKDGKRICTVTNAMSCEFEVTEL